MPRRKGQEGTVKLLLEYGAKAILKDINKRGLTAFGEAVLGSHIAIARTLYRVRFGNHPFHHPYHYTHVSMPFMIEANAWLLRFKPYCASIMNIQFQLLLLFKYHLGLTLLSYSLFTPQSKIWTPLLRKLTKHAGQLSRAAQVSTVDSATYLCIPRKSFSLQIPYRSRSRS